MLSRGFTTVRDTGGATKFLASAIEENLLTGPRLFQCGKALSQTGGHGDFSPGTSGGDGVGCCGGHVQSLGRTADGVPMILKATREELKQGADFIKVMLGGGVASETDGIETVQYSSEEIRAITSTAWQMGKKMVSYRTAPERLLHHIADRLRVSRVGHGTRIYRRSDRTCGLKRGERDRAWEFTGSADSEDVRPTLPTPLRHTSKPLMSRRMAEKGIYLTPTLSCYGIMVRKPFEDFLPPSGQVKNRQVMAEGLNALKVGDIANVLSQQHLLMSILYRWPRKRE